MSKDQFRERLNSLFSDFERLASDPAAEAQAVRAELEVMRVRLKELEAEFAQSVEPAPQAEPASPSARSEVSETNERGTSRRSSMLYEKEFVGYAFTGENIQPLSSDTTKSLDGISVPLTASGQPVGKMQVQPAIERKWSDDEDELLKAVARQASLQIENLRLLSATEQARSEAEAATRRFMHENWESYLDAIHHSERVGYAYDQNAVTPVNETPSTDGGVRETINVMDEHVGTLYLQPDPSHPLTEEDRAMIAAIANRVADQVENIRLLADASRARSEAEEATRRLTRENWQQYFEQQEDADFGYVYDTNQVLPLKDTTFPADVTFSQPLMVRGEPIGQLAVAGREIPADAAQLAAAIATQTSIHLETLRLNDELRKRAAELQELDRLKSAFLANMSHELRTPLNSILGFADVILEELDGPLTENMATDLRLIYKNGQHLLHLINDVLDMAKITAGRMNLIPEKFVFHDLLEDVTSLTSSLASEHNIALFIDPESDMTLEVNADRTRMRQVMINLVNNAIKFTEHGKIRLHVERQDDLAHITVKDTGLGIPPDKLESIFQEFTQVDTSTTRKVGGTGLGLPISRRLCEMHGGRLWAESTGIAGEGSIFHVELPIELRLTEPVEKQEK